MWFSTVSAEVCPGTQGLVTHLAKLHFVLHLAYTAEISLIRTLAKGQNKVQVLSVIALSPLTAIVQMKIEIS
jgi:hypothetical protein